MTQPRPPTRDPRPRRGGHGGKRRGAGAPEGNLNGFKHGNYSRRYRVLIAALADSPDVAANMRALAEAFSQRASVRAAGDRAAARRARRPEDRRNRSNQENGP